MTTSCRYKISPEILGRRRGELFREIEALRPGDPGRITAEIMRYHEADALQRMAMHSEPTNLEGLAVIIDGALAFADLVRTGSSDFVRDQAYDELLIGLENAKRFIVESASIAAEDLGISTAAPDLSPVAGISDMAKVLGCAE